MSNRSLTSAESDNPVVTKYDHQQDSLHNISEGDGNSISPASSDKTTSSVPQGCEALQKLTRKYESASRVDRAVGHILMQDLCTGGPSNGIISRPAAITALQPRLG
ncbi:hypothetical protein E4U57_001201 [Claviceps arundinis]|uniref:Uncharacterized protein n=1 Tax=Claviceps arundinis TaxID=1623583 RepID=A0ABQ7PBE3_9HYPO|nr:hypothetical protein E4U57_001201 [Claviceps arundinis]